MSWFTGSLAGPVCLRCINIRNFVLNPAEPDTKKKLNLRLKLSWEAVNTQSLHALLSHHNNYNITENGCTDATNKRDEQEEEVESLVGLKRGFQPTVCMSHKVGFSENTHLWSPANVDMKSFTLLWQFANVRCSFVFILLCVTLCFSRQPNQKGICPFVCTWALKDFLDFSPSVSCYVC